MNFIELPIGFECAGARLQGVLCRPERAAQTGVVIVVGGPQYRAGSHRQFVSLARSLAAAGHAVLRFDVRGMGDSEGTPLGFEQIAPDIAAALDALQRELPSVRRAVLWGLCDGASAALLYLHENTDLRVAGLALANPWVRTHVSLARTHVKHYYLQRLREPAFWSKLLRGGVAWSALAGSLNSLRTAFASTSLPPAHAAYPQRMASAWAAFGGPVLLILSEHDYTALEFEDFLTICGSHTGMSARFLPLAFSKTRKPVSCPKWGTNCSLANVHSLFSSHRQETLPCTFSRSSVIPSLEKLISCRTSSGSLHSEVHWSASNEEKGEE